VKQILEDSELIEMMKEVLIHEGKPLSLLSSKIEGRAKGEGDLVRC